MGIVIGKLSVSGDERYSLLPVFRMPIDKSIALIFGGASYAGILKELRKKETETKNKILSYSKVYRQVDIPIHLLSCDEIGAKQLAWMRQEKYKQKTLNLLAGVHGWKPATDQRLDASLDGAPFVYAADMNLRRVFAAVHEYANDGIYVCAMEEQIPFLDTLMPAGVNLLAFSLEKLESEFGGPLLYTPNQDPAQTAVGGYYHV